MSAETVSKKNILIGTTGSVATIKLPEIISGLKRECSDVEIKLIPTKNSLHFLPQVNEVEEKLGFKMHRDEEEWTSWNARGDPVLHIELRKWADIFILGIVLIKIPIKYNFVFNYNQ